MPKMKDHQRMEELYTKIVKHMDEETEIKPKKKAYVPLFSLAAAVVFFAISITSVYLNQTKQETAEMNMDTGEERKEEAIYDAEIAEIPESSDEQYSIQSIPENNTIMEDTAHTLTYDKIKQDHTFLGLRLGMSYEEMIGVIGSPLEEDVNSNIARLKYSLDGYGVEATFDGENGPIREYTFYPQYLADGLFKALPKTKADAVSVFGEHYDNTVQTCPGNTSCNTYTYNIDSERYIQVQIVENKETVFAIRYGLKK